MHNGIIAIPNKIAKWSDTMHFAQFCLAPILSTYPSLFGTEMLRGMLEYFVGKGNKLLLMNGDGNVVILNEKEGTNKEGCWISNTYSIYHHHMYEYENWENDWEYPVVRREQLTAVMPTQAISPPAAEFSSGSPNGENHFCEGCQLSMRADDWMHISGLGYFCPTCATVLEHDFKTIGPFSLNDAALMGYQALKDLCKNSPETVAYMLMNEYRQ